MNKITLALLLCLSQFTNAFCEIDEAKLMQHLEESIDSRGYEITHNYPSDAYQMGYYTALMELHHLIETGKFNYKRD